MSYYISGSSIVRTGAVLSVVFHFVNVEDVFAVDGYAAVVVVAADTAAAVDVDQSILLRYVRLILVAGSLIVVVVVCQPKQHQRSN